MQRMPCALHAAAAVQCCCLSRIASCRTGRLVWRPLTFLKLSLQNKARKKKRSSQAHEEQDKQRSLRPGTQSRCDQTCAERELDQSAQYCSRGLRNAFGKHFQMPRQHTDHVRASSRTRTECPHDVSTDKQLTLPQLKRMRQTSISIIKRTRMNEEPNTRIDRDSASRLDGDAVTMTTGESGTPMNGELAHPEVGELALCVSESLCPRKKDPSSPRMNGKCRHENGELSISPNETTRGRTAGEPIFLDKEKSRSRKSKPSRVRRKLTLRSRVSDESSEESSSAVYNCAYETNGDEKEENLRGGGAGQKGSKAVSEERCPAREQAPCEAGQTVLCSNASRSTAHVHTTVLHCVAPLLYFTSLVWSSVVCVAPLNTTLLSLNPLLSFSTLFCFTSLYSTPLYRTLLYSTLLYPTLPYSVLLYSAVLYFTVLYSALQIAFMLWLYVLVPGTDRLFQNRSRLVSLHFQAEQQVSLLYLQNLAQSLLLLMMMMTTTTTTMMMMMTTTMMMMVIIMMERRGMVKWWWGEQISTSLPWTLPGFVGWCAEWLDTGTSTTSSLCSFWRAVSCSQWKSRTSPQTAPWVSGDQTKNLIQWSSHLRKIPFRYRSPHLTQCHCHTRFQGWTWEWLHFIFPYPALLIRGACGFYHRCVTIFKCLNNLVVFDFNLRKNKDIHDHNTRRRENLHLPIARTNWGKQRFVFASLLDWNSLDPDLQSATNFETFKSNL